MYTNPSSNVKSRIGDGDLKKFHDFVVGNSYPFYVHHDLILSHNLQDDSQCDTVDQPSILYSSLPLPASSSTYKNITDTSLLNIIEKEKWKLNIQTMKSSYKKISKRRRMTRFTAKSSTATIPMYLLKFAKLLVDDPDPYFDSQYNWYFSGNGNLCLIDINGFTYVLKSANNSVYLHRMINNYCDKELSKYTFRNDDIIYETKSIYCKKLHIVGLRLKFKICLLHLVTSNDVIEFQMIKILNVTSPITSFVIDQDLKIYYTSVDGAINYHDIDTSETLEIQSNSKNDKSVNNWSSLHLLDNNDLFQTSGNEINIYDKRKEYKHNQLKDLACSTSCEKISASKLHPNNNYIYIGNTHNIQLYDIRLINQHRFNFVKKWTHGLQIPPLFIQYEKIDEYQVICVSNQSLKDICIILDLQNYGNIETKYDIHEIRKYRTNCNGNLLPWHPPTIIDTYDIAQKTGYCLDPTVNLEKRLNTSRTGNVFLTNDNNRILINLNSLGEMFQQTISFENLTNDDISLSKSLQTWADQIPTMSSFSATDEINLIHYFNVIRHRNRTKLSRDRVQKSIYASNTWKNKLKYMFNCTDFCANEFLSAWELTDEDYGIEALVPPPPDTTFNVKSWMSDFNDF